MTIRNGGNGMCAIPFDTGFVTVGGKNRDGMYGMHGNVDRYNSEGEYLDSLPNLAVPRYGHACIAFISNGDQV